MGADEQRVRTELVRQQHGARGTINRGIVLLALVPVVITGCVIALLSLDSFMFLLVAMMYTLVGGVAGIALTVGGRVDHRRLSRELRTLDAARQLPQARVVER